MISLPTNAKDVWDGWEGLGLLIFMSSMTKVNYTIVASGRNQDPAVIEREPTSGPACGPTRGPMTRLTSVPAHRPTRGPMDLPTSTGQAVHTGARRGFVKEACGILL